MNNMFVYYFKSLTHAIKLEILFASATKQTINPLLSLMEMIVLRLADHQYICI